MRNSEREMRDLEIHGLANGGTIWRTLTQRELDIFLAGVKHALNVIGANQRISDCCPDCGVLLETNLAWNLHECDNSLVKSK